MRVSQAAAAAIGHGRKQFAVSTPEPWQRGAGRRSYQKRELISSVTKAIGETTGCEAEAIWIVIDEEEAENWGLCGELAAGLNE